jgi:hypothetical protein
LPDVTAAARNIEELARIASPDHLPDIRRLLAEITSKFADALTLQVS